MEAVPAGAEAAPAAEAPDSAEISPEYEQPEVRAVAAGKRKHGSALEGAENKVNEKRAKILEVVHANRPTDSTQVLESARIG